jgi:hypothetical protein
MRPYSIDVLGANAAQQLHNNIGRDMPAPPRATSLSSLAGDLHQQVEYLQELVVGLAQRVGAPPLPGGAECAKVPVPSLLNDYETLLSRLRNLVAQLSSVNAAV